MECGNCGGKEFANHVKPRDGTAKVTETICMACGKVFKLDPEGRLGGGYFTKRKGHEAIAG